MTLLLPALQSPTGPAASREAVRFGDLSLTYGLLAGAADSLAARIADAGRVALWATPAPETVIAVVAALRAGVPAVPLNPRTGERELTHILGDSEPTAVLAGPDDELPPALEKLRRVTVDARAGEADKAGEARPDEYDVGEAGPEDPALIVYTSGTTGPPKGAVLPRRAVAASLDALEDAWAWTGDDVLVHALPLFHVHGLILGVLGPLRRGGSVRHLGKFSPEGVARELGSGGTMLFGVPTMYHRLAQALDGPADTAERDALAVALSGARLLVSGSAALPLHDHERIAAATGRRVIERYGMTETLMNTGIRADGVPRPGTVGPPLAGVELRLAEDDGAVLDEPGAIGEIQVRGPNLFTGYLNRPDATAAAHTADGWFRTGDVGTVDADGYVSIVGRKATDLIKSGGYKIGAGEIENVLLAHPGVREVAVTGEEDPDLGERVVAWVVATDPGSPPSPEELADRVAAQLAPHKRPRTVRYLDALPRNDLGKIMKRSLRA
ncbi:MULTISPECIES: acyl-CoA synthetase [Streptomyces]|uniref:acyl-CoA synthetase n=1 Tax=Streptomyces TaxID=1883 RepID=UPI0004CAA2BE|nr:MULTISPECIES: acyl-CoA synthetase [Streptomyces]MDX2920906.1 acyl-CoA synthetase [Streptomyces sp. NE06-03C]MDX3608213.1 acyl-CoA synthetase [Streptomyces sp. FL06-04B]MDX3738904.1 acyl-CoA synthetase [Streptomyces sp. ID01-15D]